MDRAKLGIALYTLIGLALAVAGGVAGFMAATGQLAMEEGPGVLVLVAAAAAVMIGLHWLIVGIASMRE